MWLAVQQRLYRGWGPFVGPFEVTAVLSSWWLLALAGKRRGFSAIVVAACCLSGALAVFFVLNAPVNAAFAGWTAATLPPDWQDYRLRWELGHAISFLLVLVAFIGLLRASFVAAIDRAVQ